jgi:hypothetical protein
MENVDEETAQHRKYFSFHLKFTFRMSFDDAQRVVRTGIFDGIAPVSLKNILHVLRAHLGLTGMRQALYGCPGRLDGLPIDRLPQRMQTLLRAGILDREAQHILGSAIASLLVADDEFVKRVDFFSARLLEPDLLRYVLVNRPKALNISSEDLGRKIGLIWKNDLLLFWNALIEDLPNQDQLQATVIDIPSTHFQRAPKVARPKLFKKGPDLEELARQRAKLLQALRARLRQLPAAAPVIIPVIAPAVVAPVMPKPVLSTTLNRIPKTPPSVPLPPSKKIDELEALIPADREDVADDNKIPQSPEEILETVFKVGMVRSEDIKDRDWKHFRRQKKKFGRTWYKVRQWTTFREREAWILDPTGHGPNVVRLFAELLDERREAAVLLQCCLDPKLRPIFRLVPKTVQWRITALRKLEARLLVHPRLLLIPFERIEPIRLLKRRNELEYRLEQVLIQEERQKRSWQHERERRSVPKAGYLPYIRLLVAETDAEFQESLSRLTLNRPSS